MPLASAAYDSDLAESSISLSFCTVNHIHNRHGSCNTTVTVEITTGGFFTCAIRLRMISESLPVDRPYDVILGRETRDWFKLCSTGLEDNPDAAVRLSSLEQWLFFAASPKNAIHTQLSFSSEFLIYLFLGFLLRVSDLCLETSTSYSTIEDDQNNDFSDLQHAIGSDANRCCSFDFGSDAASSSKIYHNCNHDQSNSEVLTSFIEKDSQTIFELTGADDCEYLNSIENILTSIENMFKPSLLDLANSHGVKFNSTMSSEELKNIISDHLCKGCCFSSTYEGCLQVTSILNKKNYDKDVDRFDVRALLISHLSYLLPKIKLRPLRRLLSQHDISYSLQDNLSSLRRKLKTFIKSLKKGKCQEQKRADHLVKEKEKEDQHESRSLEIHNSWPQIVPQDLKKKVIEMFREETSSKTLSMFT